MSGKLTILKNTVSMFMIRIFTPAFFLALLIYMTRTVGAGEVGKFSVLITFLQMVQFLPLLGLQPYIVREVSRDRTQTSLYLSNLSCLSVVVSAVCGVLFYFAADAFGYPRDMVTGVLIVSAVIVPNTSALIFESVIMGHERMELIAGVTLVENLVKVIVSIMLLQQGFGINSILVLTVILRFAASAGYYVTLKKFWPDLSFFAFDRMFIVRILKACPVFLGIMALSVIITRLGFIVLSVQGSFHDVGIYTVAYKIYEVCILFSSTFLFALFPVFSRVVSESREKTAEFVKNTAQIVFMLVMLLVTVIFCFADHFIPLLFSGDYFAAVPVLKILIFAAALTSLDQILGGLLIAGNMQALDFKVLGLGVIVYVAALFTLIPLYGITGAGWATVAVAGVQMLMRLRYVHRHICKIYLWRITARSFVAAGITRAVVYIAGDMVWWYALVPLSGVVYVSVLFCTGALKAGDIRSATLMVSKKFAGKV